MVVESLPKGEPSARTAITGDAWSSSARALKISRPSEVILMKNSAHIGETQMSYLANTEGSHNACIIKMLILHARKNLKLYVSNRQEEILAGCLLGDAYITKRGQIVIEQSNIQKDYLLWKYAQLKSLAYPSVEEIKRLDKRNNKTYSSLRFVLRQYFRSLRNIFYPKGIKIFPESMKLTSLGLAVWYMDDGCWSGGRCILSVDGFCAKDREAIQRVFLEKFGVESIIRTNKKLLIRKKSQKRFFSLIEQYIIPSMGYKIMTP